MRSKPASVSIFMVPGKSAARFARTGYVWHPRGIPSGLPGRLFANAAAAPAAAMNSRLESGVMIPSGLSGGFRSQFAQLRAQPWNFVGIVALVLQADEPAIARFRDHRQQARPVRRNLFAVRIGNLRLEMDAGCVGQQCAELFVSILREIAGIGV